MNVTTNGPTASPLPLSPSRAPSAWIFAAEMGRAAGDPKRGRGVGIQARHLVCSNWIGVDPWIGGGLLCGGWLWRVLGDVSSRLGLYVRQQGRSRGSILRRAIEPSHRWKPPMVIAASCQFPLKSEAQPARHEQKIYPSLIHSKGHYIC